MKLQVGLNDYTITVNKYNIHIKCKFVPDSKDVLLFFHGLACSWDSFKNAIDIDYFPDKTLLFIDHIGFGESSKPEDFSYTMKEQAKIIDELLTELPTWDNHIVAHSMGTAIALHLKSETYGKVKTFTNIEGNLVAEDCGIMSRGIAEKSFEEYKKGMYKMHLFAFSKHEQLHFRQTTAYAVYHSAVSLVKESDSGELLEKFKNLNCKKAYFYGEENKNMPVLKRLDSIDKQMISNSGHAMTSENPEEFYRKLVEFIHS
jgi:pimeloyl-ACP methyl ester carboxylesterase